MELHFDVHEVTEEEKKELGKKMQEHPFIPFVLWTSIPIFSYRTSSVTFRETICLSKCLKSRSFRYLSFGVMSRTQHALKL